VKQVLATMGRKRQPLEKGSQLRAINDFILHLEKIPLTLNFINYEKKCNLFDADRSST